MELTSPLILENILPSESLIAVRLFSIFFRCVPPADK